MKREFGIVHIPLILAGVVLAAGLFLAKDKILGVFKKSDAEASIVNTAQVPEEIPPDGQPAETSVEETTVEKEAISVFGSLLPSEKPSDNNNCDLTQYMLDPEGGMPFSSIIMPLPSEKVEYPAQWPQEFIYPPEYKLVDSGMGQLTAESAQMYKAFLLFEGKPTEATCGIIRYFEDKSWEVEELVSRNDLGFIVVLRDKDGVGTGLLNAEMQPQDKNRSKLTISLFPEAEQSQ